MIPNQLRAALLAGVLALLPAVAAAQTETAAESEDPVVARVNGQPILLSDLQAVHAALPEQYRNLPLETIYAPLLERIISIKVIAIAGREAGLDESEAVKRELARVEDQLLEQAYIDSEVAKAVSDDSLRQRYDAFTEGWEGKEVRARHILLEDKTAAEEVIEALNDGADFAELAQERSIGPSKAQGGDLGFFDREQLPQPFTDAAFALEVGETTPEPVQTRFGWHVIKVEESREAPAPPFEDIEPQLRSELEQEVADQVMTDHMENAEIERFNADGSPMTEDTGDEGASEEGGTEEKQE